jgi:hypothetical protein
MMRVGSLVFLYLGGIADVLALSLAGAVSDVPVTQATGMVVDCGCADDCVNNIALTIALPSLGTDM